VVEEDLPGRLRATRGVTLEIGAVERESDLSRVRYGTAGSDDEQLNGQEEEVGEMRLPKELVLNRCPPRKVLSRITSV